MPDHLADLLDHARPATMPGSMAVGSGMRWSPGWSAPDRCVECMAYICAFGWDAWDDGLDRWHKAGHQ